MIVSDSQIVSSGHLQPTKAKQSMVCSFAVSFEATAKRSPPEAPLTEQSLAFSTDSLSQELFAVLNQRHMKRIPFMYLISEHPVSKLPSLVLVPALEITGLAGIGI